MSRCLLCHEETMLHLNWRQFLLIEQAAELCDTCRSAFVRIEGERCQMCSRPLNELEDAYKKNGWCQDCLRWEEDPHFQGVLEKNISLFMYNEAMKEWVARFKYRGDYVLARSFAADIRRVVEKLDYDQATVIPLSDERLHERGFNQAKALATEAGVDVTEMLRRVHTEKQSKKSRSQRMNSKQVFHLHEKNDCQNKKILIFDDIYTTGSTLRQAAKLLKEAGAKEVCSFTLVRG
ncbi:ComF family protein [Bacillus sp. REN10]|uniref:ComF family protein n=1 Tax=Bacillus sp. REN10 TaxID=2782541 RepID=UPI00193BB5E1|nr:ComF family protein [Bacillus sp. REN10]